MIEQTMVKSSLLYPIHNRNYSYLKNVHKGERCYVWVKVKCYAGKALHHRKSLIVIIQQYFIKCSRVLSFQPVMRTLADWARARLILKTQQNTVVYVPWDTRNLMGNLLHFYVHYVW